MSWASLETYIFVMEVGSRAAMHAESCPRDAQWFTHLRWTR